MNSTPIILTGSNEPRVDSRLLAQHMGRQHKPLIALIDRYHDQFKRFSQVLFKKADGDRIQGGGMALRYALLNEDQSYFLLTLVRNSERVVELKARLVMAFREVRQRQDIHRTEYLPSYHALHDEIARLAANSPNGRFVHMNVNKAINQAVGIHSGERSTLPLPGQSLLAVAQSVASQAMASAHDHREGYQRAKAALLRLNTALLEVGHE